MIHSNGDNEAFIRLKMRKPDVIVELAKNFSKLGNKGLRYSIKYFSNIFEKSCVWMNMDFQVLFMLSSLTMTKIIYISVKKGG